MKCQVPHHIIIHHAYIITPSHVLLTTNNCNVNINKENKTCTWCARTYTNM